ncbi:hypothetical protein DAEQUDRAFT_724529 [Daedalea quercina L-15889]|uniref:Uncharacterized protein n=1 Tax=Daedalea quercina L-15889 TaxID=1314783 RepID=A0A165RU30_9APHY|nr:hypothetical protein DAEQUDRAFT_724529 [Daedalea quercina L-15889]
MDGVVTSYTPPTPDDDSVPCPAAVQATSGNSPQILPTPERLEASGVRAISEPLAVLGGFV